MIVKLRSKVRAGILVAILILAGLLYLSNASRARFGSYNDDSIYVTAAKALATGQGYRFIGLPFDLAQTKYPIFYPFLLAIIWAIFPQFPANLVPMMALSLILMLAFVLLAYLYIRDRNYAGADQALLIMLLMAINPALLILSSSLLSDMLYATLSIAVLWMVERLDSSRYAWRLTLSAGITLGLSYLTRSVAIALLASVVLYLVINRQFKKALVISVTAGCFIVPWLVWCRLQAGPGSYGSTFLSFYTDYVSFYHAAIGELGILKVFAKNALLLLYFAPMMCLALERKTVLAMASAGQMFIYLNLFMLMGGFIRQARSELRLAHLYVIAYMLTLVAWPFPGMYERFLAPILPLLLLYLTTEVVRIMNLIRATVFNVGSKTRKKQTGGGFLNKLTAISLLLMLAGWLATILYYGLRSDLQIISTKATYADRAKREEKIFKWVREHTNPSDVLICYRDQIYYLFTGRKAVRPIVISAIIKDLYANETLYPLRQEEYLFSIIKECKAQYLITDPHDFDPEPSPELLREKLRETITKWPQIFVPVYTDAGNTIIYRIGQ